MKKNLLVLSVMGFILMVSAQSSFAAHTRVTYPSSVSAEVLGRGIFGGVYFDQVVSDQLAVGVGYGFTTTKFEGTDTDTGKKAHLIPVYMSYYFMKEAGSVYATAGVDVAANVSDVKYTESTIGGVKFSSSPVLPVFGIGYENRTDTGFLFRVAGYGIVGKKLAPWLGFQFGVAL